MADAFKADMSGGPKRGRVLLRGMTRIGLLAAAGYAAYTFAQWARYGSVARPDGDDELLDRVMPDYEVCVRRGVSVDAPADVAFNAICDLDFRRLPALANLLFRTRELVLHSEHTEAELPLGLLDQLASFGWTVMPDSSAREVVLVTATQPWEPTPKFHAIPPDRFTQFDEPGFAKIAMTLRTQPDGPSACEVLSETRVKTTDPVSRERFRRYWALVAPGVALVRAALLAHVKREAERKTASAVVEHGTVSQTDRVPASR